MFNGQNDNDDDDIDWSIVPLYSAAPPPDNSASNRIHYPSRHPIEQQQHHHSQHYSSQSHSQHGSQNAHKSLRHSSTFNNRHSVSNTNPYRNRSVPTTPKPTGSQIINPYTPTPSIVDAYRSPNTTSVSTKITLPTATPTNQVPQSVIDESVNNLPPSGETDHLKREVRSFFCVGTSLLNMAPLPFLDH